MESFFGSLKTELASGNEACAEVRLAAFQQTAATAGEAAAVRCYRMATAWTSPTGCWPGLTGTQRLHSSRCIPAGLSIGTQKGLPLGVRPWRWTESSCCFDPLPGVLIFELRRADTNPD